MPWLLIGIIAFFVVGALLVDLFFLGIIFNRGPVWLEAPKLRPDWLCAGDTERTIKNLIQVSDRYWVLGCKKNLKSFKNGLLAELAFLSGYDAKEFSEAKEFIEKNLEELYDYALKVSKFYPKNQ